MRPGPPSGPASHSHRDHQKHHLGSAARKRDTFQNELPPCPSRRHDGAPAIFKTGRNVQEWLEDFETMADLHSILEADRPHMLVNYAAAREKVFIKSLDCFNNREDLKHELLDLYPSALRDCRYNIGDLNSFAHQYREINHCGDFENYHRDFLEISNWLKTDKKVTQDYINECFWMGLPNNLRMRIKIAIRTTVGAAFTRDTAFEMKEVLKHPRVKFSPHRFDAEAMVGTLEEKMQEINNRAEDFNQRSVIAHAHKGLVSCEMDAVMDMQRLQQEAFKTPANTRDNRTLSNLLV